MAQTERVRILLLNQVFQPDPQATSRYLSRLAEELAAQGHNVTVLASRRAYGDAGTLYPARETWCGVEIIRVWSAGFGHGNKIGLALNFLTFLLAAAWRGLFLGRFEVIVALTTPPLVSVLGTILAWVKRARFIYWVMDLNPDEAMAVGWLRAEGFPARFLEVASRWSLRRADRVIVLDDYMRDRVRQKEIAAEKIEVIPLWVQDEAAFDTVKREEFRAAHGWEKNHVVMYAGNHTPCHPLDTLVEAVRLLQKEPRLHFCFAGFGTEWAKLQEQARVEEWGNVTFLGYHPPSSGVLAAADTQVVVMGEPFVGIIHPCKIYNFLAAQRPFVSIGPARSHISDLIREAGLEEWAASFSHGESQALADELKRRAEGKALPPWPPASRFQKWSERAVLDRLVSALVQI